MPKDDEEWFDDEAGIHRCSYSRLVHGAFAGRGLEAIAPGMPVLGHAVRAWDCSLCKEWSEALSAKGLSLDGRVAPDADMAAIGADGLCEGCRADDMDAFVARVGATPEARDPANYIPSIVVTQFMIKHGLLRPLGTS